MKLSAVSIHELELSQKVALLKDPRTYPHKPTRIDTVETHMSWVFLTDTHAYKLKKPVRYDFLDFSTLGAREWNCREELRLNPPLAPDVYLAVVPLAIGPAGALRLEGEGAVVEWLVKMRRLPAEQMLDHVIRAHRLHEPDIERLAQVLMAFYRNAPPVAMTSSAYRKQFERMIELNRAVLSMPRYRLSANVVARTHDALSETLASDPDMFGRRVHDGRIVEGHGDLRPEHVCLEERPVVFDRLEFNREFRLLDAVDELCFLAMECERLGVPAVGRVLFNAYRAATGDDPPERLRCFYSAHRACVRARLAVLHTDELEPTAWDKWLGSARKYLNLAEGYCRAL
jgi:aminoglycoside phosphotransferase family enzyme